MIHTDRKLLYEVSIIRPIVILLLVLLHSFEKIANGGLLHQNYHLIWIYRWLVRFIKGFRIETIALVAGYVFAYQSLVLGRKYSFFPFVKKKFFRLIVPMLVFGSLYYFCFLYDPSNFSMAGFTVKLLSGCGHLWFLPMLFWCFIAIWTVDHFHLSSWWLLLALAILTIIPTPSFPFGFSRLPHFLFYVYFGYFLWEKREYVLKFKDNFLVIASLWLTYCILVPVNFILPDSAPEMSFWGRSLLTSYGLSSLLLSCSGIMALYLTVCHFTEKEAYHPKQWVIDASGVCYGVYVFHQFILVWLYFYTPLVSRVPNPMVPIIGFTIALSMSLALTKLLLKTKVGQFLIG